MDRMTPAQRSATMRRIKRKDTSLEMGLRRALWARGLRYRTDHGPFHADVAFPAARVAVFVDSCFWHRCPRHRQFPATNAEWWRAKLERNAARDKKVNRLLRKEGWTVMRVWEHSLRADPASVADRIEGAVRSARPAASAKRRPSSARGTRRA